MAFLGSTPIGGPFVGWASETFDPRAGLAIVAIAALVTAAIILTSRQRRTRDHVTVQPADLDLATSSGVRI